MKKRTLIWMLLLLLIPCLLASCSDGTSEGSDGKGPDHTHVWVEDAAVEATCTTPGKTAGKHCSVCGQVSEEQSEIPARGHDVVSLPGIAPTCLIEGSTAGRKCSRCDYVEVAPESIAKLPHNETVRNGKAATCTSDGYTEERVCSKCGTVTLSKTVLPAPGHSEVTETGEPSTCREEGWTDHVWCSECHETLKESETVPPTHTPGTDGICTRCGEYPATEGLVFERRDEEYAVGLGTATAEHIYIPSFYNGLRVTAVMDGGFDGGSFVKSIHIPWTLASIYNNAFADCTALTQIHVADFKTWLQLCQYNTGFSDAARLFIGGEELKGEFVIPSGISSIGKGVFSHSPELVGITIPADVCWLYATAFRGCTSLVALRVEKLENWLNLTYYYEGGDNLLGRVGIYVGGELLTDLVIPASVDTLKGNAFYGYTRLDSVTVPAHVKSIGSYAFFDCTGLESVTFSADGVLSQIGSYAFRGCTSLSSLELPASLSMATSAFIDCTGLRSVALPAAPINIGSAFQGCTGLTSVTVPSGVKSIDAAFRGCTSLESVRLLGVVSSSVGAFSGCTALSSVVCEEDLIQLGNQCFMNCTALTEFHAPKSLAYIGNSAFEGCASLRELTLGERVESIGSNAFKGCTSLERVNVLSVEGYLRGSFGTAYSSPFAYGASLYIGEKLLTTVRVESFISDYAFYGCPTLVEVILGDSLISVGDHAFENCTGLVSVQVGSKVTFIAANAFAGCPKIVEVKNKSTLSITAGATTHGGIAQNALRVYTDGESCLTRTENDLIFFKDGDTALLVAFAGSYANPTLPDTLDGAAYKIHPYALYGCNHIVSLSVPFVGESADGTGMTHFGAIFGAPTYQDNGKYVPASLKHVTLRGGGSVRASAFYGCTSLTSFTLSAESGVTLFMKDAFDGCTGLTAVYVYDLSEWAGLSFASEKSNPLYYAKTLYLYDAESLTWNPVTDLVIPEGTAYIGGFAFYGLTGLRSVSVPQSVTSIGYSAFAGCTAIEEMTLPFFGTSAETSTLYGDNHLGKIFGTNKSTASSVPQSLKRLTLTGETLQGTCLNSCTGLEELILSDGVTGAADQPLKGCSGLKYIEVGASLTTLPKSFFEGLTALEQVLFKGPVLSMGAHLFSGCSSLREVVFLGAVESIAENAFANCKAFTSVTFSSYVRSIGRYAFSNCTGLRDITLPEGLNTIEKGAFHNCKSLSKIVLPASLTDIGDSAFYGCTRLIEVWDQTSIGVTKGSEANGLVGYYAIDVYADATAPQRQFETADGYLFYPTEDNIYLIGYLGTESSALTLPKTANGSSYAIYKSAFEGCYTLASVILPEGLTEIGEGAFYQCESLTSIRIPDSVTTIGKSAFVECKVLQTVVLGENSCLTSLGEYAFYHCEQLTAVHIPDGIKQIEYQTFYRCYALAELTFGANTQLEKIGNYAFQSCNGLTVLTLPDTLKEIGDYAFNSCGGLAVLAASTSSSLTRIGNYAFQYCSNLRSVTVPPLVTLIGDGAFESCSYLVEVRNYSALTITPGQTTHGKIGQFAKAVYTPATPDESRFVTMPEGYLFFVCEEEVVLWQYTGSATELTLPSQIDGRSYRIQIRAFRGNKTLTAVHIPEGVTAIGQSAFQDCDKLTTVTIGASVTMIDRYAFYGTPLTSVTFASTDGWVSVASNGTETALELSDPAKAADLLRRASVRWEKK